MSLKYFYSNSIDPNVVGTDDGVGQIELVSKQPFETEWIEKFTMDPRNFPWMDLRTTNINSFEGEPLFKLYKKAKLTDLMGIRDYIHGCELVSGKLKRILETANLESYIFKKIQLQSVNNERLNIDYWLMQTPITDLNKLNWLKTWFYYRLQAATTNFSGFDVVVFRDKDEYAENNTLLECVRPEFIDNIPYDLISAPGIDIMSEKLKGKIEGQDISGIDFERFMDSPKAIHTIEEWVKLKDSFTFK